MSQAVRDQLLRTFNERFYIELLNVTDQSTYQSPVCSDVHAAIASALEYFALEDIEHRKRDTITLTYAVALHPDGPWAVMPVGPAWRLCSPQVQSLVEKTLVTVLGAWVVSLLTDGDVERLEATISQVEANGGEAIE